MLRWRHVMSIDRNCSWLERLDSVEELDADSVASLRQRVPAEREMNLSGPQFSEAPPY